MLKQKAVTIRLIVLLFIAPMFMQAQVHKFEIQEKKGTVEAILPGWLFAYCIIQIKSGEESNYYNFPPNQGLFMLEHYKPGDPIEFRAKVDLSLMGKESTRTILFRNITSLHDLIQININGIWTSLPPVKPIRKESFKEDIILEKTVVSDYFFDGYRSALVFADGTVAYFHQNNKFHYPMKDISPGDRISFVGFDGYNPEYAYPVKNPKKVILFLKLAKETGTISELIFNRNYACIGFTLSTSSTSFRMSIPGDQAMTVKKISDAGQPVTVYFKNYKAASKNEMLPTNAIVGNGDSVCYFQHIYSGAEGWDPKHEFKTTNVTGKIIKINHNSGGSIANVVVAPDWLVEVGPVLNKQLGNKLRKGVEVTIKGIEQLRLPGEYYEKDYRIVTPQNFSISGSEFTINP